jgi:Glycosyl transferase family 2
LHPATTRPSIALSVVVVTYDQERELPRTLRSFLAPYQRDIDPLDYEVIVVDNGSPRDPSGTLPAELAAAVQIHRVDPAAVSPARAANVGLGLARGELIGLVIDGARMASPRLLSTMRLAARLAPRVVATAPAWHIGPDLQHVSTAAGYDEATEDAQLAASGWEEDGYALFSLSTPAASSGRGLFGPMGESSSLFLPRAVWAELGGLDERFALPGGGLVNHDLYGRACDLPDASLVVALGEGTFHQIHGGAATSGRVTGDEMRAEYEAIRGAPHRPPSRDPLFVGRVPRSYLPHLKTSVEIREAALGTRPTSRVRSAAVEPSTGGDAT